MFGKIQIKYLWYYTKICKNVCLKQNRFSICKFEAWRNHVMTTYMYVEKNINALNNQKKFKS